MAEKHIPVVFRSSHSISNGLTNSDYLLDFSSRRSGAEIEGIWKETSADLKRLGAGVGIINANRSPQLSDQLGVARVPTVIGILGGETVHFSGRFSVQNLKDFVNGIFPSDLVHKVCSPVEIKYLKFYQYSLQQFVTRVLQFNGCEVDFIQILYIRSISQKS